MKGLSVWLGFVLIIALGSLQGIAVSPVAAQEEEAVREAPPPPPSYPPYQGIKKRLAVSKMENKVKNVWWDPAWKIGDGLGDMLTTELMRTNRFIMVERAALGDIVKEQELGQTGLVRRETASKVGELLGAQILVMGAVTEFEYHTSGGGAGIGFRHFGLGIRVEQAHVAVDIRLVDTTTGQILKSHTADAKADSTGVAFDVHTRGVVFGGDTFNRTPIGKATREAIQKAVWFIMQEMEHQPWVARVIQVKAGEVYVNAGANMNLRPGTNLAAYVKGEELIDPATGLNLGSRDTFVGNVAVTDVQEKFSIGRFQGRGALKRGDLLKLQ
jgi:curli biogenesis system outer membrane secretion channel CsgG